MEWVKCSERKPEHGKPIMISDGEVVTCCIINYEENIHNHPYVWMEGCGFGGYEWEYDLEWKEVTHWAELPDPPKPEKPKPFVTENTGI